MQEFPRIYESMTCLIMCIMEPVCLILELCALWCLYALVITEEHYWVFHGFIKNTEQLP